MTTKFYQTNNAHWFPLKRPNGKAGSERMTLYSMIEKRPGITSDDLQEQWPFASSLRSRLVELADQKCLRAERAFDLFKDVV